MSGHDKWFWFQVEVDLAELSKVIFVVMSQSHPSLTAISDGLERSLNEQFQREGLERPKIIFFHRDVNVFGNWAIVPALTTVYKLSISHRQSKWLLFVQPTSVFNLKELNSVLVKYKDKKSVLIGRILIDERPTVLHNFDNLTVPFPDLVPGKQTVFLAIWPDWAIYWTLGNFLKLLATINFPKSPTFLGNFLRCQNLSFFQWNHF